MRDSIVPRSSMNTTMQPDVSALKHNAVTSSTRVGVFCVAIITLIMIASEALIVIRFHNPNQTEKVTFPSKCPAKWGNTGIFCDYKGTLMCVNPLYRLIGSIIGVVFVSLMSVSAFMTNTKLQGVVIGLGMLYCIVYGMVAPGIDAWLVGNSGDRITEGQFAEGDYAIRFMMRFNAAFFAATLMRFAANVLILNTVWRFGGLVKKQQNLAEALFFGINK